MAGNEEIERVNNFVYLGSALNMRWDYAVKIKSQIEITIHLHQNENPAVR